MATTNYLITRGEDTKTVANKQRAIAQADAMYAADKRLDVTVTIEKSGTVVHERIGVTAEPKPRKASPSRMVDLSQMKAGTNVRGYEFNADDTHGTPTTYNKGCRCVTPVEHDGRTIYGCLGGMNEYDRWWRAATAAKKADQPVPPRPTFPAVPRARKAADGPLKGADRAAALHERMTAKTSGKTAAAG